MLLYEVTRVITACALGGASARSCHGPRIRLG